MRLLETSDVSASTNASAATSSLDTKLLAVAAGTFVLMSLSPSLFRSLPPCFSLSAPCLFDLFFTLFSDCSCWWSRLSLSSHSSCSRLSIPRSSGCVVQDTVLTLLTFCSCALTPFDTHSIFSANARARALHDSPAQPRDEGEGAADLRPITAQNPIKSRFRAGAGYVCVAPVSFFQPRFLWHFCW